MATKRNAVVQDPSQTITINGVVFLVYLDESNGVTKIIVPSVHMDPANPDTPLEIDYDPAGTISNVYGLYFLLVREGILPG